MIKKINETAEKNQAKLDRMEKAKRQYKPIIQCPHCRSKSTHFVENDSKQFSVGKAVVGAALTGGVGSLAGFAGKKGKKNIWKCNQCGSIFKK